MRTEEEFRQVDMSFGEILASGGLEEDGSL
jgi:hypothetical protein